MRNSRNQPRPLVGAVALRCFGWRHLESSINILQLSRVSVKLVKADEPGERVL